MTRKYKNILLMCFEVVVLAVLTPTVFWKATLTIGPVECYILGHYTYLWFSAAIVTVSVVTIIFVLIQRFIKSMYIKIPFIWGIIILAASAIPSLFAPFII